MAPCNVAVCVRLRPMTRREHGPAVVRMCSNTVLVDVETEPIFGPPGREHRQFAYDVCMDETVSQEELYEHVGGPIVRSALAGFNGTLFAYGQTGSGKSFSIQGPEDDPGVIPRLAYELFHTMAGHVTQEEPAQELRVSMSLLEIYNEEIRDLLDPRPKQKKLFVHHHPKLGVHVPNLTEAVVTDAAVCKRMMDFGAKMRATAQTNMNSTSSRSHLLMTMRLTQVFADGRIRHSGVNVCDLAGSERQKKTGAIGQRAREGCNINASLSVLGQVISKLATASTKKGGHVPFRQSKLTYLLMDALSGNSLTTMLANVSPAKSEVDETLSTLRFAESVKRVKTKPCVEEHTPEETAVILETYKGEVTVLKEVLLRESTPPAAVASVARAIDAQEHWMTCFTKRTGPSWTEAVEKTQILEEEQRQVLEERSIQSDEVGQLMGFDASTPYLLNISDDPSLTGCLIYFLRAAPEVNTVGHTGRESICPNNIVLQGLGIPARLCEIWFQPSGESARRGAVTIRNVADPSDHGRLVVNGRLLTSGEAVELKHGDRLMFGWAFCFRLVATALNDSDATLAPWCSFHFEESNQFEDMRDEAKEHSRNATCNGLDMMRAVGVWQEEFTRRGLVADQSEEIMESVADVMVQVEEANALCSELQTLVPSTLPVTFDIGVCFSFLGSSRVPSIVVQVWHKTESRLLAAWPSGDLESQLVGLRDAHREAASSQGTKEERKWAWRLSSEEFWQNSAVDARRSPTAAAAPTLAAAFAPAIEREMTLLHGEYGAIPIIDDQADFSDDSAEEFGRMTR